MPNFKLKQTSEQVQKAIDNALYPDKELTKEGVPADSKSVGIEIKKNSIHIGTEAPTNGETVWIDTRNVSVKYRDPKTGTFAEVQSGGSTDDGSVKKHNESETAHNDIRLLLADLSERLNAIADSDDTTLDQLSEIVAYIKANKTLIESVTTSKVNVYDIIDNLTTSVSNKPLSAKMGVELRRLISTVENSANNAMSQASSAQSMASSAMNHASSAEEIASSAMQRASSAEQMASAAQAEIEKFDKKVSEFSKEIADKVSKNGITLGLHSDGKYYIFVDGAPVGTGFELSGNNGDVFGYVDENNNIILNGNLADGSYSIKYEMEDGSAVDIGVLVLDSNVYYSVTNNLTNCTNSNSDTRVIAGQAYTATITANSGYELKSVTVTMGGADISSTAVSGGKITISNVTGNIVITAVAEVVASEPINQIPLSTDASGNLYNGGQGWKTGYRLSSSSGSESSQSGIEVTGFIPCKYTDTIYFKNITITSATTETYCFYDSSRTRIAGGTTGGTFGTTSGGVISKTISSIANTQLMDAKDKVAYIRISANAITADSIITINEPIS